MSTVAEAVFTELHSMLFSPVVAEEDLPISLPQETLHLGTILQKYNESLARDIYSQWPAELDVLLATLSQGSDFGSDSTIEWPLLREIIKLKITSVVTMAQSGQVALNSSTTQIESTEDYLFTISASLDLFIQPPLTLQRLCELLVEPFAHYKNVFKYLRALEKMVTISTLDVMEDMHVTIVQTNDPTSSLQVCALHAVPYAEESHLPQNDMGAAEKQADYVNDSMDISQFK